MTKPKLIATKLFLSGPLAGLTFDDDTVPASLCVVGREVKKPIGGSPYRIIAVRAA
jgi:hypothetical protein